MFRLSKSFSSQFARNSMEIEYEKEKTSIDSHADGFNQNYHNQAMIRKGTDRNRFRNECEILIC